MPPRERFKRCTMVHDLGAMFLLSRRRTPMLEPAYAPDRRTTHTTYSATSRRPTSQCTNKGRLCLPQGVTCPTVLLGISVRVARVHLLQICLAMSPLVGLTPNVVSACQRFAHRNNPDEGIMVTGVTLDATDDLVQKNIVAVGYKNVPQ